MLEGEIRAGGALIQIGGDVSEVVDQLQSTFGDVMASASTKQNALAVTN